MRTKRFLRVALTTATLAALNGCAAMKPSDLLTDVADSVAAAASVEQPTFRNGQYAYNPPSSYGSGLAYRPGSDDKGPAYGSGVVFGFGMSARP